MLLHPFAPYGILPPGSPMLHPAVFAGMQGVTPPQQREAATGSGRPPQGGESPMPFPHWLAAAAPSASGPLKPSEATATREGMSAPATPPSSTVPRHSMMPMMLPMPGAYAAYPPVLSSPMALPLPLPGMPAYVPGMPSPLMSPPPAEHVVAGSPSPSARALHEAQRKSVEHQMRILEAHMDILKLQGEVLRQRTEGEASPGGGQGQGPAPGDTAPSGDAAPESPRAAAASAGASGPATPPASPSAGPGSSQTPGQTTAAEESPSS